MEIQNPPQFTLEEVIVIDFSDAGGGNPGNSSPKPIEAATTPSSEKEITQEESPVTAPTNNSKVQNEKPAEKKEVEPEPAPKNDFSNLFGKGSGDKEKVVMEKEKEQVLEQEKVLILVVELVTEKAD